MNEWVRLVFGLEKRYSLPILFLLFYKGELTFDQLYDICLKYRSEESSPPMTGVVREKREKYKAISRESISRATTELLGKHVVKKARLGNNGRSHVVYVLNNETKDVMKNFLGHPKK